MVELGITVALLIFGLTCGTYVEKKHYESIRRREAQLLNRPVLTTGLRLTDRQITECRMVVGCVAISIDYFKNFSGLLRNIFGGRVGAYESLIDRARREATLRMKEQAAGYDEIICTRLETSPINGDNNSGKGVVSIEAIAYGTAIRYAR